MAVSLPSRRWGLQDWIVGCAAGALLFVSFKPWSAAAPRDRSDAGLDAWTNRRLSEAVVLALLATLLLFAYRSRNARGAAGLAVVMLVGTLGLEIREWHRARTVVFTEVGILTARLGDEPEPSQEELRRQTEEIIAAGGGVRYGTEVRPAFYAGAGATALLLVVAARTLLKARKEEPPAGDG